MTKLKAPSVLAYSRKINPTNALMFAVNWNDRNNTTPVMVGTKTIAGTQSVRGNPNDADKGNIQTVNFANLPHNKNTLLVKYNVKFVGDVFKAELGGGEYSELLKTKLLDTNFKTLAYRYVYNIAAGRTLWRNRVGAESIETVITVNNQTFTFSNLLVNEFDEDVDVAEIADMVAEVLSGEGFVTLKVEHYVLLGEGSEVFPSQEFVENSKLSKQLFDLNGQAAMHDQKVGNAIRTIDTWYEDATTPIAVEPYGSVVRNGVAYRAGNKTDLFTLMDGAVNGKSLTAEDQMFVTANLIRGGVFGGGKG